MRSGDVLLTQGPPARINTLKLEAGLLVLDGTLDLPRTRKAPIAIAIMVTVIVTAAMNVLPISLAAVLGVLALLVTGCLEFDGLGRGISAEVVLIVVSSLALGRALTVTGGAQLLAGAFMSMAANLSPQLVLAAVMAFLGLLTNFVSNSAAAAVGTPVALAIAQQIGARPSRSARCDRRLQPVVRDADGLPDQHPDHAAGRLRVSRLRARRRPATCC